MKIPTDISLYSNNNNNQSPPNTKATSTKIPKTIRANRGIWEISQTYQSMKSDRGLDLQKWWTIAIRSYQPLKGYQQNMIAHRRTLNQTKAHYQIKRHLSMTGYHLTNSSKKRMKLR